MTRHAKPGLWPRILKAAVRIIFGALDKETGIEVPAAVQEAVVTWAESYDAKIIGLLYEEVRRVGTMRAHHWVMDAQWFDTITHLVDSYGEKFWEPPMHDGHYFLLGIPVLIRTGLGHPKLVPHMLDTGAFRKVDDEVSHAA